MSTANNASDYDNGQASARREIRADGWTAEAARAYLASCAQLGCADGRDDFDRGFMSVVRALAVSV